MDVQGVLYRCYSPTHTSSESLSLVFVVLSRYQLYSPVFPIIYILPLPQALTLMTTLHYDSLSFLHSVTF